MNRMYGSKGQIKVDPTGAGGPAAVAVGSMASFTLNMARNKADVTSFGDANLTYVQGLPDIKGTLGGWFDSDELTIFDIAMGDVACFLELIPSTIVTPTPISGPARPGSMLDRRQGDGRRERRGNLRRGDELDPNGRDRDDATGRRTPDLERAA